MKKDRRQINKVWQARNPHGELFTYAKIGSGKNSYIKTISYNGYNAMFDERKITNKQTASK